MSNKKQLPQIYATDASKISVSALAVRPNDASRFGQGGLSAKRLQEWFDQLPNLVKDKFNEIAKTLASDEAAKYIGMNALGVDNLHDFIALFGERGKGLNDKNISDYIQALYTHEGDTEPESISLQFIVSNIVERVVQAKAAQEVLDELIRTATLTVRPGNVINLNFDTGNVTVDTSAQLKPVSTDGIEDGAVTKEKLVSSLSQTIEDAFTEVEYDSKTGSLKFNSFGGSMNVSLPLEMVVNDGYFDDANNDLVLVLNNGKKISIPLDALSDKITSDIAELKEKLDGSFMDVRLSDDQKLIFTLQDNSEKQIILPDSNAGGGSKLYKHDIYFAGVPAGGAMDVWFTIYNSDPTDYSVGFDGQKLTAENFAFLPNHDISATGWVGYEYTEPEWGTEYFETVVDCISNRGDYIYICGDMGQSFVELGFDEEYWITDTVTEIVLSPLENGDEVRY